MASSDAELARFVGDAYRSLEEAITGLELCQRIYPSLPASAVATLIDEGHQISRMAHSLIAARNEHRGAGVVTLMAHSSTLIVGGDIKGAALDWFSRGWRQRCGVS